MQMFARVVEVNSFNKAAESLSLPPSTVTRALKELEEHLGVRLLQRTTRRLSLTPDGSIYYAHCRRLLDELNEVEASFHGGGGQPRGKLRVDMTPSFARNFVIPSARQFLHRYPEVQLAVTVSDRPVDLVQEGIDCVIRAGQLEDSTTLVARRIASFGWMVCATPEYLAQHGTPLNLEDLRQHQAVLYLHGRTGRVMPWMFVDKGESVRVDMTGSLSVNDTTTYVDAGLQGLGLICTAGYLVRPHIESGALVQLLADYALPRIPISVMYPQNRHLSPTVRAFIDWITELMAQRTNM
ncbi:LysR family transcriptional regulator [Pseudoduganella sp. LjRoot289]|uniref:LysR family transcriptional regulator n=1 Tax=Pseudoduganella sp. LjRoot289 TaxID=3342314 RepID=UPI003ECE149D